MIPVFISSKIYSNLKKKRDLVFYKSNLVKLRSVSKRLKVSSQVKTQWYGIVIQEPEQIFELSEEEFAEYKPYELMNKIESDIEKMLDDDGPVWKRLEYALWVTGWKWDSSLSDEKQIHYSKEYLLFTDRRGRGIYCWVDIVLFIKELRK